MEGSFLFRTRGYTALRDDGGQQMCAVGRNKDWLTRKALDTKLYFKDSEYSLSLTAKFKFFLTRDYFIHDEDDRVVGVIHKRLDGWFVSKTHYQIYLKKS